MQTRKYPRTLQEAFGPYTDHRIVEPTRPFDWQDKVVLAFSAIGAFVFALLVIFRVIV